MRKEDVLELSRKENCSKNDEREMAAFGAASKVDMKKEVKIIALLCAVFITIVCIFIIAKPKTLDFRGTVTEIEVADNRTIFHISTESIETSYTVVADSKTKISHCHKDDPLINLADIKIGDTIEGNYRRLSKEKEAKFITVWYTSNTSGME